MTPVKEARPQSAAVAPNAFAGYPRKPNEHEIAAVLGPKLALWKELVADLQRDLKIDAAEWQSSSRKLGWSMRLSLKKRNIVYLGPREKWFLAAFALSDKAVAAARKSALPAEVLQNIAQAKRYPEGAAVRIEVRKPQDAAIVKTLAKIKIEN